MMISKVLKRYGLAWKSEEDGSVAIETILMIPLMVWVYLGMVQFFHAYKHQGIAFKANLTIADMFSREADYVSPEYIDGAKSLLDFLARIDDEPDLRVTALRWVEDDDEYQVSWSKTRGSYPELTTADLQNEEDRIPIMYDNEMALLVETWVDYDPPFNIGMDGYTIDAFTVISPRFTRQLCYNTSDDPATQEC